MLSLGKNRGERFGERKDIFGGPFFSCSRWGKMDISGLNHAVAAERSQLFYFCNPSRATMQLFSFCNTSRARAPNPTGSKPNRALARKNKGFAVRNTLSLQNGYHFDSEVELDTLGVSFCIRVQSHDATFVSEAESKGEQRSNTKRLHGGQTKQEDEVIRNG